MSYNIFLIFSYLTFSFSGSWEIRLSPLRLCLARTNEPGSSSRSSSAGACLSQYPNSFFSLFLDAEQQGYSERSLIMPCPMTMFLSLLKITHLMHASIMPFLFHRSITLLLHIHPSMQRGLFIPSVLPFHWFIVNVLTAGPQVFEFALSAVTISSCFLHPLTRSRSPSSSSLRSYFSQPVLPLHFGSSYLTLLKLPMDLLTWI